MAKKASKQLSKNLKKVSKPAKAVAKSSAKGPGKPSSKVVKPSVKKGPVKPVVAVKKADDKKLMKSSTKELAKAAVSAVGKLFSKAKPNKTDESPVVKKEKAVKKSKSKKKDSKDGLDFGDDLLTSDEEMGSEDIPDLSEFDENESDEVDTADSDVELNALTDVKPADDEIYLTDAEGRRYCRVRDCDQISAVEGYCRYHYLLLWKRIQVRRKILVDGKLERYVEELTARYPDKFLEMIRKDLRSEKDFVGAIAELEIDESANENEMEEDTQNFIDEVRGISSDAGTMSDDDDF